MRRFIAAVVVMLFAAGCSILDPSDRQELRDRIGSMPPEEVSALRVQAMWKAARDFFNDKKANDQIGKLECRIKEHGEWGNWSEQLLESHTVADMRGCLWQHPYV